VRLTIIHDVHGNITSVVASPPNSGVMYLGTRPGQCMTEVERPELTLDQGMEHLRKHLTDMINNHLVVTKTNEGRLAKKPALRAEK
jgi:hypothetical protein